MRHLLPPPAVQPAEPFRDLARRRRIGYLRRAVIGLALGAMPQVAETAIPRPDHVVIVVEENDGYDEVIGSRSAPYINGTLVAQGAVLMDYHAVHHPSQPNYLELFAGSSLGVINDTLPTHPFDGPSLGGVVQRANLGFVGYAEDMPRRCTGLSCGDAGSFVTRHCPWLYFTDLADGSAQSMGDFPSDFSRLPTVAFVIPNVLHDMHGVRWFPRDYVKMGDTWLKENLGSYAQWAMQHNSMLIVTWDEDATHYDMPPPPPSGIRTPRADNRVPLILFGKTVKPGTTNDRHYDHLDLLRTLEDLYGLPHLGDSEQASDIEDVWTDH